MEDMLKKEEEFLRGVYCKVSYLEQEKKKQELIEKSEKLAKKKKLRYAMVLGGLALLSITFTIVSDFDAFVILISFMLLMVASSYYEFILEI
ncbi:hypothetical protein J2Z44_001885 [Clostridium punense]|uniref:Uncharacterized protein n=1 Tax=Clostridium punense TaxID=1054297 RepID=A0ABS4K616_9CLOT|nr:MULTISPECIES: hypothetical protein [Clostridium]EQB87623.1 hypothetical protein M918_07990 [Clostridium sp. BL8]MBP2022084.1 hypothetical protein [Clostridium punense]